MLSTIVGLILILHGMVHLLYAGQSWQLFELRPEMTWPAGSWLFSKSLGDQLTRQLSSFLLALSSIGFAAGGLGLILQINWWQSVMVISTVLSSLLFFVLWNGKFQALSDQGGIGLLINLAILLVILEFNWPS